MPPHPLSTSDFLPVNYRWNNQPQIISAQKNIPAAGLVSHYLEARSQRNEGLESQGTSLLPLTSSLPLPTLIPMVLWCCPRLYISNSLLVDPFPRGSRPGHSIEMSHPQRGLPGPLLLEVTVHYVTVARRTRRQFLLSFLFLVSSLFFVSFAAAEDQQHQSGRSRCCGMSWALTSLSLNLPHWSWMTAFFTGIPAGFQTKHNDKCLLRLLQFYQTIFPNHQYEHLTDKKKKKNCASWGTCWIGNQESLGFYFSLFFKIECGR